MTKVEIGHFDVSLWLLAPALYAVFVVCAWTIKKIAFSILRKLTERTQTKLDDIFIAAIQGPLTLMILVWGAAFVSHFVLVKTNHPQFTQGVYFGSKALTIIAAVLFFDRFVLGLLQSYATRVRFLSMSAGFATPLVHIVVAILGGLIFLDSVGVSITPIIASLGIGSLAVALALQPTLENIFAGFQILIDRAVKTGDYVKLESGEEGYVHQIGWRSTWVRQLSNNMVIIPNKQLVNSRLTNFYEPTPQLAVLVEVGVHYSSDLNKVEQVTCEVADEIMKRVQGGVPDFKTFIRFHTLAASSINFTVIMQGKEFTDNFLIKHEFIKALAGRYAREKIVIPYPITALNLDQEGVNWPKNGEKASHA